MPKQHCSWGKCNSDSRYRHKEYMQGVFFVKIPDLLADPDKYKRWVHLCGRADFNSATNKHDSTKARWRQYICSKHFVGGNGPTDFNPDPLPATYTKEQIEKATKKTVRVRPKRRGFELGDEEQPRKKASAHGDEVKQEQLTTLDGEARWTQIISTAVEQDRDQLTTPDSDGQGKQGDICAAGLLDHKSVSVQCDNQVNSQNASVQTDRKYYYTNLNLRLKTELVIAQNEIQRLKLEIAQLKSGCAPSPTAPSSSSRSSRRSDRKNSKQPLQNMRSNCIYLFASLSQNPKINNTLD